MTNDSRKLQNYQHVTGGLSSILLQLTGVFSGMVISGTLPWYVPVISGVTTFILTRISSEITYKTSVALFSEYKR